MINSRSLTLFLSLFMLTTWPFIPLQGQTALGEQEAGSVNTHWQLIFADEFNNAFNAGTNEARSFDSSKWNYCPRAHPAWAKYLTASPGYAFTDNGHLVLKMDDKKVSGDASPYHSGGIQSAAKFTFTYGKVEVRAKFNQGKGAWPAIWLMPETATYGHWPLSGEIDIMEHVNFEPVIHQTIHNAAVTDESGGSQATHSSPYKENAFNIYGIIWDSVSIQFYVNHDLQYRYTKKIDQSQTQQQWPFDKPFYLILNQSGGAGWPGALDSGDLPFTMQVDWVHVYQTKK